MSAGAGLRVAVVGSGPAGFYAAGHLLAGDAALRVDLFERLPTPWGLVRFGVAPDHPRIKEVARVFERTAKEPRFRFFGNVEVGAHVSHQELRRRYNAVVYAVGARADRRMGIPGEDLPGSWAATQFVAWYNGHPDYQDLPFDLGCERAVIVGAGNVAVDVARMLALTPEELRVTDATDQAIAALSASRIREIEVLARRGPAQAAFTTPELKELGELSGADVIVDPADLAPDEADAAGAAEESDAQRNFAILQAYASRPRSGAPKALRLRFRVSPVAIGGEGRVEAIDLVRNELVRGQDGTVRAVPTGRRDVVPCGLVLRSVGYRGTPVEGVPFDQSRGTIPNREGRVLDERGAVVPGIYCVGWIKRGPSGVIGTNKKDAAETVRLLLEDARSGVLGLADAPSGDIAGFLAERGVEYVTYQGWEAIDAIERARGSEQGRPRVKISRWDELLAAARPRSGA